MDLQHTSGGGNDRSCHPRASGGPSAPQGVDSRSRGNDKRGLNSKRAAGERSGKAKGPQTLPFLLEVGCEEIPARFLVEAQYSLGSEVIRALQTSAFLPKMSEVPVDIQRGVFQIEDPDLGAFKVETYSTPRRLVVHVPALLARQPDRVEEILGPPVKVAVDAAGNYTRAAESFAQKNSARPEDLVRTSTPKGEYLALRRTTQGRPAQAVLPEILPAAILGLTFPKSMYWTEKSAPRFVRPIRWVLAVLGEGKRAQTVDFEILGVKSGNFTFGHRVLGKGKMNAKGFSHYAAKLRRAYVEFDRENRRQAVRNKANVLLEDSLKLIQDPELEEWIVNSTEWPSAIRGGFDERFLHLPREILITVMRDHQKYFAVEDGQGNLRPYFVAVLNVDPDEKGLIREGHERVLAARFRDAEFFWEADQRVPLRDRLPLLEKVTYHAELGTYRQKIERMELISDEVAGLEVLSRGLLGHLRRAIELSKCDLTTQMVQEFPELQGVVGGLYAEAQGEAKEVSDAIKEHYLPQGFEGCCPKTIVGALTSFVDKFDAVIAGFAAGLEPKGSNDPFAMRRYAAGIIKVILEFNLPINLQQLVVATYARLNLGAERPGDEVYQPFLSFFGDRLRYYLESIRGFRYDTVRAVLAAGFDVPADALARAEAMEVLRGGEDFEALSVAAKRIRNILMKSATAADWKPGEVEEALLKEPQERELHEIYAKVAAEAGRRRESYDYRGALEEISTLRPAVDCFFDGVLVMAEDLQIRQNRLRLLKKLEELFSGVADFAEIEGR